MPQSLSVFAVSLQEHPELLEYIIHLLYLNVNSYYCSSDNTSGYGSALKGTFSLQFSAIIVPSEYINRVCTIFEDVENAEAEKTL
jgi:hypothetical protein